VKRIFISAGHSDADPGVVSKDGKREADLAEVLRNRIVAELRAMGLDPISDGEGTVNRPLPDAVKIAKQNAGGINIEIHFNGGPPTARGVEALCYLKHAVLAKNLCGAIAKHTKSPLRGKAGWKAPHEGQHPRLAFCEAGGVILEVEFISSVEGLRAYLTFETEIARDLAEVIAAHAAK
jgi:N-acetylmuramoyl-L-alanine amidase